MAVWPSGSANATLLYNAGMLIRTERGTDRAAVHAVNAAAFPTPAEADLVDALRRQARPLVSLVAERDGTVVGHILFSPLSLGERSDPGIMGLAPMAVAPEHQRSGIGSALVRAGLDACRELGFAAVVVLGHPEYYPRFGFVPSVRYGIRSEYDVPDEVFMVLELVPGSLRDTAGTVKYHPAFGNL
jgi:putative acetyltransferase